ncbi:ComEA family DNA-binding protein [bacterium]|nr:ComEA family DNA-binding protein [bacterium]
MAAGLTRTEQYALIGVIGLIVIGVAIHGVQRMRSEPVSVSSGDARWEKLGEIAADGTSTIKPESLQAAPSPDKRIDINRAGLVELDRLPGIGPAKARAIIETRDRLGGFRSIEQLDEVKGIGPATIERLRPLIKAGETTATVEASPDRPAGLDD